MSSHAPVKPRKSLLKRAILAIALVVGAYYGISALRGKGADSQAMPQGMPASVSPVVKKRVTTWSEFSGRIEAVNAAEVRPRVGGQIAAVHFKDGSVVQRGQALFTLDTRPFEAELVRTRGAVLTATAAQKNAAQEFARAQALIKTKSISKAEYEHAESMLTQSNGALETARGAARGAEVSLAYSHIAAPISGTISRAELTVGNNVEAGPNAPVMASIVDLSPIYASFELDEKTYLQTVQGVAANKRSAIPVEVVLSSGTAVPAKIHAFDNQISPGSGTIRVRAVLKNGDGALVPGMFAKVRLGSVEAADSVLVNPVALGTDQNKKFVLVVDAENKVQYREVVPGAMVDGLQVITAGLTGDETVVVGGLQRLRPGMPVMATAVDMETLKPLDEPAPTSADASSATEVK